MDSDSPSERPALSIDSAEPLQLNPTKLTETCEQEPSSTIDSPELDPQTAPSPESEGPPVPPLPLISTPQGKSQLIPDTEIATNDLVPKDGQVVTFNQVIAIPDKSISTDQPSASPPPPPSPQPKGADKNGDSKAKKDENPTIFKALAIKLKKELIKAKGELQTLRDSSDKERCDYQKRLEELESALELENQINCTKVATLEAQVVHLKQQVESSELDYQHLQKDFESYKTKASQMLQQNKQVQYPDPNKKFDEDRYKRLKELNDEQTKRISTLETQLASSIKSNKALENDISKLQKQAESILDKDKVIAELSGKRDNILRENENLKLALQRFRSKLNDPEPENAISSDSNKRNHIDTLKAIQQTDLKPADDMRPSQTIDQDKESDAFGRQEEEANILCSLQPEDSQHISSSSSDGSASGYVHIKPNTFEIISRSTVLKDVQIQIDNLTKAYLESENTNSLLSEQVKALKDEIRRMQRVSERMDLADNLEYLKNVLFKFLSLDSNQVEQRKRLIPVLSTVLKLSPDESSKLNSMNFATKPSMANSFFKL